MKIAVYIAGFVISVNFLAALLLGDLYSAVSVLWGIALTGATWALIESKKVEL